MNIDDVSDSDLRDELERRANERIDAIVLSCDSCGVKGPQVSVGACCDAPVSVGRCPKCWKESKGKFWTPQQREWYRTGTGPYADEQGEA